MALLRCTNASRVPLCASALHLCSAPLQALRLGTFLNETKPVKVLHRGEGQPSASSDPSDPSEPKDPIVLRLGNYLSGGAPQPQPQPPASAPAAAAAPASPRSPLPAPAACPLRPPTRDPPRNPTPTRVARRAHRQARVNGQPATDADAAARCGPDATSRGAAPAAHGDRRARARASAACPRRPRRRPTGRCTRPARRPARRSIHGSDHRADRRAARRAACRAHRRPASELAKTELTHSACRCACLHAPRRLPPLMSAPA